MKKLLQISLALATAFGAFAAQAQDVKAGEKKIAMCIGCHGIPGYQASFPEIHKVPMIAGQNAKYIVAALQAYAKGDRKPKPEFISLVGSMAALVFSVTKEDTTTGASRCLKRMGLLRGDKVNMRFRRLTLECQRNKTEAWIAITRGRDE